MKQHMFFFDIDGTLLECKDGVNKVSEQTKKALKSLQYNGHKISLATGRPYAYLPDELLSLNFDSMILSNGALIINDQQTIYRNPLDKQSVLKVIDYCLLHDIEYVLEGEKTYDCPFHYEEMNDFFRMFDIPKQARQQVQLDHVYKIAVIAKTKLSHDQFMKNFKDDFQIICHDHKSSDLFKKTQSKARGIKFLSHFLNIDICDTVCFGDGLNDVEMLDIVGLSVAMGNAKEEVKKHADFITTSYQEEGIYEALKHFGFID